MFQVCDTILQMKKTPRSYIQLQRKQFDFKHLVKDTKNGAIWYTIIRMVTEISKTISLFDYEIKNSLWLY